MSQFSDAKTYGDLQFCFDAIGTRLNASRRKLLQPDGDARQVAFAGIQRVVGGYAMGLSSMLYGRTQNEIIKSFGKNNLTVDGARQIVEDAWKNGLITLFHFKVDTLFQNLLRVLGAYKEKGFEPMSRTLLSIIGITDAYSRDVLLTTGYIRNSLHNNGMHRGKSSLTMKMQDLDFIFVSGKRMECGSWQHIFAAMYETIDVVDRILATDKVKGIPTPFEDDYARDPAEGAFDPVDYTKDPQTLV